MRSMGAIPLLVAMLVACSWAATVGPAPDESAEAKRWVLAKFDGKPEPPADLGYLLPKLKSGALERNTRQHHQLEIAGRLFDRGIHCPSVGTIEVHLAAPARHFSAWVGVDSNDITYYSSLGRGNVRAAVTAGGKDLFQTAVMREGVPAIPVELDLAGAADFT